MPRPEIHSRDHEWGGADPVGTHYEDVGDGGSGPPGFVNQAEKFSPSSYTTVGGTAINVLLPWVSAGPDTLLDTTSSTAPTVLVDGLYTINAVWSVDRGLTAPGKVMTFIFQVGTPVVGVPVVSAYFVQQAAGAGATVTPGGVGSLTLFIPAGTTLTSEAANFDTSSVGVKNRATVYRIM